MLINARAAVALALLGGTFGCTPLRSEDDTCASVGPSCSVQSFAADAGAANDDDAGVPDSGNGYDWSCQQVPALASIPAVTLTLPVIDYTTSQMPAQLLVCVCKVNDWPPYTDVDAGAEPCLNPISCSTPTPADAGDTSVTVPLPAYTGAPNFYVTFEAPNHLPVAVWFNTTPPVDFVGTPGITMFDLTTALNFATGLGVNLDLPLTGIVVVTTHDCTGKTVAGIQATLTSSGQAPIPFILTASGVPVIASDASVTDISGQYGFAQVAAGLNETASSYRAGNVQVGSLPVYVRPGWATAASISPTPPP